MADLQKTASGGNIVYPGTDSQAKALFKDGGTGIDGKAYPKVDMSVFDQATMCGTCHVGGPFYEHDRNGLRLSMKTAMDMQLMMAGQPYINPFTSTVWESYTPAGADASFVTLAPWIYPQYNGNNPAYGAMTAPYGWGSAMRMPNPNGTNDPYAADAYVVVNKQLMMPNLKETDCLFCHLKGYDNVMSSVMTQAGSLNAAPAAGAGLFDMTPGSPTYMGYNGMNGTVSFTKAGAAFGPYSSMQTVSFTPTMVGKIAGKPEANNCMQCHATKTLKDMPEMFGVTGTSSGFLSSAPMIYDPANGVGPLGKRMTAYDINAMWLFSGSSPVIDFSNFTSYMMPGMPYLQAFGATPFNGLGAGQLGGGNPAQMGPLFYYNDTATPDQNVLKRSVPVFARAEWFKRGDTWQDGQDVHGSFGCAGCHYTGDTTHKNQCDPGRGFDMASTVQDGVPPLFKRQVVTGYDANGVPIVATTGAEATAAVQKADTRNTIKRCEFCHVTGKDYYGQPIDTFGAPNPATAHQNAGLTANLVQMIDKYELYNGAYGGMGIPEETSAAKLKAMSGLGSHLDVMDCTVCHVQKKSMVVRSLDATSGMRYPAVLGTDNSKGMIGLFEDPAPDSFNDAVATQYNQMYQAMGYPAPYQIDPNTGHYPHVVGSPLNEWKPLHIWQKLGNMELPLTVDGVTAGNGNNSQLNFRRKIYLTNPISAILWNNTDPAIDANGDTAPGGTLNESKPSLVGYTDIFTDTAVNKNNTQGYGEPIYDPWIMRDLKAGFNFGPSALSVISIGFGPLDGTSASASAYKPDGTFSDANYWKYASVWSGAVIFTEPDQIRDYKNFRTAMGPKSWAGTKLSFIGAPFMVTHGVKPKATYVKGKNCADCHAPGAEFFNGGFTMTGTAIPADRTFNPTAMISPTATQNAQGDFVRPAGFPGLESASNLMQRPLEPFRVKGYKGDLFTAFEGMNKLGQPRSSEFLGEYTDPVTHVEYDYTRDIQRADVLYPHEHDANGELKIYCKITDDCAADPSKLMNGQQYADYLETLSSAAAYGIGINPVASIGTIPDANASRLGVQVVTGEAVSLSAAEAQTYDDDSDPVTPPVAVGTSTYTWSFSDGTASKTGKTASVTFSTLGTRTITLTVKDEEGKQNVTTKTVEVVALPIAVSPKTATVNVDTAFTVSNLPSGWTKLKIYWGDGTYQFVTAASKNHKYTTAGSKYMKIYVYNSGGTQIGYQQVTITVAAP